MPEMTNPLEEPEFAAELRQLLVAAALGDATDTQVGRLNELLLRDERLRHQAAIFFEEEAVLRREFEVLDRVVEFHKPLAKDCDSEFTPSNAASVRCKTRFVDSTKQRLYLAVAVLLGASLGIVWLQMREGRSPIN